MMPADFMQRLFANWRADSGAVCSMPVGARPENFWAELECAFLNTYQARWQGFADSVGLGFAQGKTMLFRRVVLESAGGIRALVEEYGPRLSALIAVDGPSPEYITNQAIASRRLISIAWVKSATAWSLSPLSR